NSRNNFAAAIPDLTKAEELAKEAWRREGARSSLVGAFINKGDYDLALEKIRSWSAEMSPNARYQDMLGRVYNAKSDYEKALEHASEAIRLEPKENTHYVLRTNIYRAMGKYDLALEDAGKAIELAPDFAMSYVSRAQIHLLNK